MSVREGEREEEKKNTDKKIHQSLEECLNTVRKKSIKKST